MRPWCAMTSEEMFRCVAWWRLTLVLCPTKTWRFRNVEVWCQRFTRVRSCLHGGRKTLNLIIWSWPPCFFLLPFRVSTIGTLRRPSFLATRLWRPSRESRTSTWELLAASCQNALLFIGGMYCLCALWKITYVPQTVTRIFFKRSCTKPEMWHSAKLCSWCLNDVSLVADSHLLDLAASKDSHILFQNQFCSICWHIAACEFAPKDLFGFKNCTDCDILPLSQHIMNHGQMKGRKRLLRKRKRFLHCKKTRLFPDHGGACSTQSRCIQQMDVHVSCVSQRIEERHFSQMKWPDWVTETWKKILLIAKPYRPRKINVVVEYSIGPASSRRPRRSTWKALFPSQLKRNWHVWRTASQQLVLVGNISLFPDKLFSNVGCPQCFWRETINMQPSLIVSDRRRERCGCGLKAPLTWNWSRDDRGLPAIPMYHSHRWAGRSAARAGFGLMWVGFLRGDLGWKPRNRGVTVTYNLFNRAIAIVHAARCSTVSRNPVFLLHSDLLDSMFLRLTAATLHVKSNVLFLTFTQNAKKKMHWKKSWRTSQQDDNFYPFDLD